MTTLIIGAGTAGAALAVLLARDGHEVALIGPPPERDAQRIGECLPGFAAHWLRRHALPGPLDPDSPHWTIPGSITAWNGPPLAKSYLGDPWGAHFRLDRQAFDQRLYDAALSAGAKAHPGLSVARERTAQGWTVTLASGETLAGDLLVDATGRRAWATRELRSGEEQQPPLIGVWAVGRKTQLKDRRTVTETGSAGWWYGCLLPTGRSLACLHCDKETAAALIREPQRWWALLGETQVLPRIAAPDDFVDARPRGTDARGVMRRPLVGERWIAIGDAALAFDPIASHGISFALFSAQAAHRWIASQDAEAYAAFCEEQWRAYSDRRTEFYAEPSSPRARHP